MITLSFVNIAQRYYVPPPIIVTRVKPGMGHVQGNESRSTSIPARTRVRETHARAIDIGEYTWTRNRRKSNGNTVTERRTGTLYAITAYRESRFHASTTRAALCPVPVRDRVRNHGKRRRLEQKSLVGPLRVPAASS